MARRGARKEQAGAGAPHHVRRLIALQGEVGAAVDALQALARMLDAVAPELDTAGGAELQTVASGCADVAARLCATAGKLDGLRWQEATTLPDP